MPGNVVDAKKSESHPVRGRLWIEGLETAKHKVVDIFLHLREFPLATIVTK